jgi:hypothetical protein
MSFEEFQTSVAQARFPAGLTPALQALWHDARGDWDQAHGCVQDDGSVEGAWVHAYLHRKEGDISNAAYWYARARRPVVAATLALDDERTQIARALLAEAKH